LKKKALVDPVSIYRALQHRISLYDVLLGGLNVAKTFGITFSFLSESVLFVSLQIGSLQITEVETFGGSLTLQMIFEVKVKDIHSWETSSLSFLGRFKPTLTIKAI
jgi:hypothetical protein